MPYTASTIDRAVESVRLMLHKTRGELLYLGDADAALHTLRRQVLPYLAMLASVIAVSQETADPDEVLSLRDIKTSLDWDILGLDLTTRAAPSNLVWEKTLSAKGPTERAMVERISMLTKRVPVQADAQVILTCLRLLDRLDPPAALLAVIDALLGASAFVTPGGQGNDAG